MIFGHAQEPSSSGIRSASPRSSACIIKWAIWSGRIGALTVPMRESRRLAAAASAFFFLGLDGFGHGGVPSRGLAS